MAHNLASLSDVELAAAYGDLLRLLKDRGIIHTNNLVGDLGEYLTIGFYNSRPDLPRLARAATNTTDFDATDGKRRYSIKSTTGPRTGAFHFAESLDRTTFARPPFDVVIVARLNGSYQLASIHEFSWDAFLGVKSWSKKQHAWFISLTKENLKASHPVFVGGN